MVLSAIGLSNLPRTFTRFTMSYCLLFFLFYGFSIYDLSVRDSAPYRYLQGANMLLLLLASAALSAPARARKFASFLGTALIVLNISHLVFSAREWPPGRVLYYRGYSYPDLSARMMNGCLSGSENFRDLEKWISSYSSDLRPFLNLPFFGSYDFVALTKNADFTIPSENTNFAEGLGAFYGSSGEGEPLLLKQASHFQPRAQERFWRGVAAGSAGENPSARVPTSWKVFYRSLAKTEPLCLTAQPLLPATETWALRGQGAALVSCLVFPDQIRKQVEALGHNIGDQARWELSWGLGWWLRMRHSPDRLLALDQIHRLPAWTKAGAEAGAAAFEQDRQLPGVASVLQPLLQP